MRTATATAVPAAAAAGERWAHELAAPEQGCLLIAKEGVFSASQRCVKLQLRIDFQIDSLNYHLKLRTSWQRESIKRLTLPCRLVCAAR
jgi:hypothetical protein